MPSTRGALVFLVLGASLFGQGICGFPSLRAGRLVFDLEEPLDVALARDEIRADRGEALQGDLAVQRFTGPRGRRVAEAAVGPTTARRLRALRETRPWTPAERESYWTAVLGPRQGRAPGGRGRSTRATGSSSSRQPPPEAPPAQEASSSNEVAPVPADAKGDDHDRPAAPQGGAGDEQEGEEGLVDEGSREFSLMREHAATPSLRGFLETFFKDKHVQISSSRVVVYEGSPRECHYVHCHDELGCTYVHKFVRTDTSFLEFGKGRHGQGMSVGGQRKRRRAVRDEMARNPQSVSSQRRQRICGGSSVDELPSSQSVYRARTNARAEPRAHGGVSPAELAAFVEGRRLGIGSPPWRLSIDEANSNVDQRTLVFLADSLLEAGVNFAARTGGGLRLARDTAHDIGV